MPGTIEPRCDILPPAQIEVWSRLAAAREMGFVLYGGTAVALRFGHRRSIDFDFFRSEPLDKAELASRLNILNAADIVKDQRNTLVANVGLPSGSVKLSFFGGMTIGRACEPATTSDGVLLLASPEDLLATKLKAILDRAEAKDYLDIATILSSGVALAFGLGVFAAMFKRDPGLPLRALGFFQDGDLSSLPKNVQDQLRTARDTVGAIPQVSLVMGSLAGN